MTRFLPLLIIFIFASCNPCADRDGDGDSIEKIFFSASSINTDENLIFEYDLIYEILEPVANGPLIYSGPDRDNLILLSSSENIDTLKRYELLGSTIENVLISFDEINVNEPKLIYGKEKIIFHNGSGNIFFSDLNGNLEQISSSMIQNTAISVSNTGDLIAFFENDSDPQVKIIDPNGNEVFKRPVNSTLVSEISIYNDIVCFIEDDNRLVVLNTSEQLLERSIEALSINHIDIYNDNILILTTDSELWSINIDGSELKRLFNFGDDIISFIDINQNNSKILYGIQSQDGSILYKAIIKLSEDELLITDPELISYQTNKAFWLINE